MLVFTLTRGDREGARTRRLATLGLRLAHLV
jgi:hypothetical protein